MKLDTLQEAKYANPKVIQLKRYLTNGAPKEGYFIMVQDDEKLIVNSIYFESDEDGEFISVTFVNGEDTVPYTPDYFFDNVEVYQAKRVL